MAGRGPGYGNSPEDFWGALQGVWLAPVRFFQGLDPGGGLIRPAIFVSLVLYLNLLLEATLQALWLGEFNYALIYAPFLGLIVALLLAPLLVAGLTILVLVILEGAPSRRGFGSRLIEQGLESDLGGAARIDFDPDGLRCTIAAAMERIRARETELD